MTPGEKLVKWRHCKGLSQRDAARLAGLSQPAWQAYESGGLPKTPAAVDIERITEGAVSVVDWVEAEEIRAVRRARSATKRVKRTKAQAAESSIRLEDAQLHARGKAS